jgi:hypothetical protein
MRKGRREEGEMRVGDPIDFWRVASIDPGVSLVLRAEMKLPGQAWLEFRLDPIANGIVVTQRAVFRPRGLAGRLYWWVLLPFHAVIFPGMLRNVLATAESR